MKAVYISLKINKAMRKEEEFIIYPCHVNDRQILIQSDRRIGRVDFDTNRIFLSKGRSGGSYGPDLCEARGAKCFPLEYSQVKALVNAKISMASKTNSDRSITLLG